MTPPPSNTEEGNPSTAPFPTKELLPIPPSSSANTSISGGASTRSLVATPNTNDRMSLIRSRASVSSASAQLAASESVSSLSMSTLPTLLHTTTTSLDNIWSQVGYSPQERNTQINVLLNNIKNMCDLKVQEEEGVAEQFKDSISKYFNSSILLP